MDFKFDQQQEMWRKSVRDFSEKKIMGAAFRHDAEQTFPMELMPQMKELYLWGLTGDAKYGGAGGGIIEWAIMLEEIGRVDAGLTISLIAHYNVIHALQIAGDDEQKKKYIASAVTGESIAGFALTEPDAGSDARSIITYAKKENDEYVINGNKVFVTNAGIADFYLVFAKTDDNGRSGISAFLIEKDAPGLEMGPVEDKLGARSSITGELVFDDCRIPETALLGKPGNALKDLREVFDTARIGISAAAVGVSRGAMEWGVRYVTERPAFGLNLGKFQGVRWMIADMEVEIEASRLLVYKAASLADSGERFTKYASVAKIHCARTCEKVTADTMQLFGAHGYTHSFPVERFFRDAKVFSIGGGPTQVHQNIVASAILD